MGTPVRSFGHTVVAHVADNHLDELGEIYSFLHGMAARRGSESCAASLCAAFAPLVAQHNNMTCAELDDYLVHLLESYSDKAIAQTEQLIANLTIEADAAHEQYIDNVG